MSSDRYDVTGESPVAREAKQRAAAIAAGEQAMADTVPAASGLRLHAKAFDMMWPMPAGAGAVEIIHGWKLAPLTVDNLKACCAWWQQRLRLQDWQIVLSIGTPYELGDSNAGTCWAATFKRQAKIQILDARFRDPKSVAFPADESDWECTLVHELLHVLFEGTGLRDVDNKDPRMVELERAIDVTSKTLVSLGRWPGVVA